LESNCDFEILCFENKIWRKMFCDFGEKMFCDFGEKMFCDYGKKCFVILGKTAYFSKNYVKQFPQTPPTN
jgi:hypothetical protein